MIYFDSAATTIQKPQSVYDAVLHAMKNCGNSGRGASASSLEASRQIYAARECLCHFFGGTDPSRLVFTANATESLNIAIQGLFSPQDHVITTQLEHNSVLRPLYMQRERGVKLDIVPCCAEKNCGEELDAESCHEDKNCGEELDAESCHVDKKCEEKRRGVIAVKDIEAAIRPDTKAIVCTHASNVTGNVVDIGAIGKIAREHDLLFIVDASQSAGILPIDIEKMNIDVLCFTGHKSLLGPQGTGGMYVGERAGIRPLISGGTGVLSFLEKQPDALPERLEAGTLNGPGIAGLMAGVQEIEKIGLQNIYDSENSLAQLFEKEVRKIPGVKLYGDFAEEGDIIRCPVVSLNIGDVDSNEIGSWLAEDYGISTRTGIHCAPLMHNYFKTQAQGMVRFSFSYYNTTSEVRQAIEAIAEIAKSIQQEEHDA